MPPLLVSSHWLSLGPNHRMLSKIYFDIIFYLKYDFISLELIILETESTTEAKYLDNVDASETKGKGLEAREFCLSV